MTVLLMGHTATRRSPRNLVAADRHLFAHELERKIADTELHYVRHAHIVDGLVCTLLPPRHFARLTYLTGQGWRPYVRGWRMAWQKAPLLMGGAEVIEKGIWVCDAGSPNYFHWMLDTLPRLLTVEDRLVDHELLIPEVYAKPGFVNGSLKALGIQRHRVIPSGRHAVVRELLVPDFTAESGNYNEPHVRCLRERFRQGVAHTRSDRRIFISRAKAATRRIKNEAALLPLLQAHGFEVHHFEELRFEQQAALMAEARYLVGVHGAGLTNMLYMADGGSVLELRIEGDAHNNCYFALASAMGLDYWYVQATAGHKLTQLADLEVDVAAFAKALDAMMAGGRPATVNIQGR
jgi:capsular polysaccharide biosynthesis protein